MKLEKRKFKIPIVKICYTIADFFQKITTTNVIRNILVSNNLEEASQKFATFVNLIWITFIACELIFKWTNYIVVILMLFRLWEILVVNIWLFVFRQGASKSQNTDDVENNIRLFILLIIQYFTIILMFASIYYVIFVTDSNNFTINSGTDYGYSIITWIYFSIVTIATTGYGDIFPVTNIAKISTSLEILLGMFFVLLFITNILSKMNFNWNDKMEKG